MPSDSGAPDFRYTGHDELRQQVMLRAYNQRIAGLFARETKPGQTLLDFGAGIGTIAALVRALAQPASLVCLEIDPDNVASLRAAGFTVASAPAEIPPGSMDVIYSSNVLEHIADDTGALIGLSALLKPGGLAMFWVPAFPALWTASDERVGHVRRYTRQSLTDVFQRAGFIVDDVRYIDAAGFFAVLLYKLAGRRDGRVSDRSLSIYDRVAVPISRMADPMFSRMLGKNVFIAARKPA